MRIYEPRSCRRCGKKVHLTFFGTYRRHLATNPSGENRLCPASGANALSPTEAADARRRGRI
jgi:hypothetical protein